LTISNIVNINRPTTSFNNEKNVNNINNIDGYNTSIRNKHNLSENDNENINNFIDNNDSERNSNNRSNLNISKFENNSEVKMISIGVQSNKSTINQEKILVNPIKIKRSKILVDIKYIYKTYSSTYHYNIKT